MRVVLDTNILISAVFFGGLPRLALQLSMQEHCVLLTSPVLLEEFERILVRRFRVQTSAAERILQEYKSVAEVINPSILLNIITADPSDNRILECAIAGKANAIVSGDSHLLTLGSFRKIPILTVRQFVDAVHR